MAYQADILINVRGFQDLSRIQKALEGTAYKIDEINAAAARMGAPVKNIELFTRQLELAAKALEKVAAGSPQEQRAISNYVTALNNSNVARERQNKLIQKEINLRNAATNAIRASVEANVAESQATRAARDAAKQLNKELADQERLRRKLAERGLMQLSTGEVAKGTEAGVGVQGPARPPTKAPGKLQRMLQKPGIADAIIGGSFPLLFGGGAGATIGGAAGGLIGGAMGGPLGMALSLGLSAVGQQIDAAIAKIAEMQKAINSLNVDALRESFVVVNAELDGTIRRLIEAGKYDEARAAAAEAVALQTGAIGTSIQDSVAATNGLGNSWNELVGTISTSLTLVGAPFAAALAVIIEGVNLVAQGFNLVVSTVGQGLKGAVESVVRLLPGGQQILNTIGKAVKGISEENEKIKAQAEAEIEAYDRKLGLAIQLNQIDKQRTTNVSLRGKQINIEADRQEKIAQIQSNADAKRREAATKYAGVSKEVLQTILNQITAEEKSQIILANRAALRQRELAITQEILARDQQRISLFQLEAQVAAARGQAAQQITQAQLQQLELQRNAAGSLQQELGIIDQIAAAKITSAQRAYEAAVREQTVAVNTAALELEKVKNQNARIGGMQREVELATAQYNTAVQVRDAVVAGAAATERAAIATADMERRMATLAAYTQEYARQTEMAKRYLDLQLNTVNNIERVTTSVAGAYIQINNAAISTLQAQLQTNITTDERLDILRRIWLLETRNAAYALEAARAQITAEVQRAVLAARAADLEVQKTYLILQQAKALGLVTKAHYDALEAAKIALRIANNNIGVANAIANAQWQAADAVYNAAVDAAKMKYETEKAAVAAGKYAAAVNSASGGSDRSGGGTSSGAANGIKRAEGGIKAVLKDPSLPSLQAIADMDAANKQAQASVLSPQKPYDPFSSTSEYGSTNSGNNDTNINITTGPVVEFDGTKYVTLADLEAAMRTTVNGVVSTLRTPAARSALGMS